MHFGMYTECHVFFVFAYQIEKNYFGMYIGLTRRFAPLNDRIFLSSTTSKHFHFLADFVQFCLFFVSLWDIIK